MSDDFHRRAYSSMFCMSRARGFGTMPKKGPGPEVYCAYFQLCDIALSPERSHLVPLSESFVSVVAPLSSPLPELRAGAAVRWLRPDDSDDTVLSCEVAPKGVENEEEEALNRPASLAGMSVLH